DELAKRMARGEVSLPEAVLCTSTHMALGLIYRLSKLGIRVPEDVIVIGFDTTNEGCCNDVILSAFDAADAASAAGTVDYIRGIIDPGKEILPYETDIKKMFFTGMSCGCEPEIDHSLSAFRRAAYLVAYNSSSDDELNEISFGRLMESYCLEEFTASGSPEECFGKIAEFIYLLKPFRDYQICLREDWLEGSTADNKGYPEKMMIALSAKAIPEGKYDVNTSPVMYETDKMTTLFDDDTEPGIFYFSPVHFEGVTFGYSVLRRSLKDTCELTLVYRTWLRFVSNALEMTRTKNQLLSLSSIDSMTGLYNRRGMNHKFDKMLSRSRKGESIFAMVIDMDGLKKINDTYGHMEGDHGIMLLSTAVKQVTLPGEICVRAGGDEFYIIGIGKYDTEDLSKRSDRFDTVLKGLNTATEKPYEITASIGFATEVIDEGATLDTVINCADKEMYISKFAKKR
ncbi:MAG: diguanylate cyclase, partial [Lachnospiraceae bacterium]|nr:diguanylate cyclase [Lachnospiraceae bacterium]